MENKLIDIICDVLDIDNNKISLETKIKDIDEWDSLSHVRIIARVEDELNMKIPFDKIYSIEFVKDFLNYVQ